MDPLERLVNLLALLLSVNRPLTFEEIRTRMGAYQQADRETSKRQFERDKDLLRGIGIPVEVAPTDGFAVEDGYWILREEYELPEISFTPEEVAALFVAANAPGGDGVAARAFLKLAHGTDTGLLAALADHGAAAGPDLVGGHLVRMAEAAAGNRRIAFGYRPSTGRAGEREVDAWALVFRRGSWYLVGRDRRRRAPRSFRLSRVTSNVRDLGPGEAPPQGFDAKELLEAGPWGLGKPQKNARVAFSPKVGWWAAGTPGVRVIRHRRDSWMEVEVPAADPDAFASWVLSFGPDAKVLSPKPIREAVLARLESLRAAG